jgi:UDP-N-acetyl-D-glucosamine dehydrogenase
MRRYDFDLRHRELSAEMLSGYDCVVLGVDHDSFDYELIASHAPLLVDTRGRVKQRGARFFRA